MGHPNASMIGLITTVVFVGGFAGAIVAGPFADAYGRRWAIFFGSLLTFCGTIVQTAARSVAMFISGRLVIGIGISFTCIAGPSLLTELAHPDMRGTITALVRIPLAECTLTCSSKQRIDPFPVQCALVCRLHNCRMDNFWNIPHGIVIVVMAHSISTPRRTCTRSDGVCSSRSTRVTKVSSRQRTYWRGSRSACQVSLRWRR
jgi:hypothetical protein